VDAASGLVHSVVSTAANVHELNTAAERLHGEEKVVYGDSGHLGIEKREEFADSPCQFRIAMRPGQRRALPDTPEGRLDDLIETAKAHIRAKGEHPFRVIFAKPAGGRRISLDSRRCATEASRRTLTSSRCYSPWPTCIRSGNEYRRQHESRGSVCLISGNLVRKR
jgi:IS5 family transposase